MIDSSESGAGSPDLHGLIEICRGQAEQIIEMKGMLREMQELLFELETENTKLRGDDKHE